MSKRKLLIVRGHSAPHLAVTEPPRVAQVVAAGMRGADGTSAATYQHNQASPADTWVINHNMGYRPSISIFSMGGMQMLANVQHVSENQARVYFDNPTAGYAVCS